jgi:hypothetical protein
MRARRLPFVLALVALLVVAVLIGNASGSSAPSAPASAAGLAGAQTHTWFCPGLPAPYQNGTGLVTFANTGDQPADVIVTTLPDQGDITRQRFTIAAHTNISKGRHQLGAPGSVTVETTGAGVVVEEGVATAGALESVACATRPSTHWYFPAGVTLRGVRQTLIIDNPYAADAKVNVSFRTANGMRRLERLQNLDVARRSRTIVAVENEVVREANVATQVDAVEGTVVAAQALTFTPDAGTPGVAYTLGAPAPAPRWTFAGSVATERTATFLAIMATGEDDVPVDVQAITASKTPVPPAIVDVEHDVVAVVQVGGCPPEPQTPCVAVPAGERYSLVVRGERPDTKVVAQVLTRYSGDNGDRGATTSFGATEAAPAWVFAGSWVRDEQATVLAVYNPDAAAATVDVQLVRDGKVDNMEKLQQLRVGPGGRANITVFSERNMTSRDGALVVRSSGRVFVERSIVAADELLRSTGVPLR